jgi:hypothetical protein
VKLVEVIVAVVVATVLLACSAAAYQALASWKLVDEAEYARRVACSALAEVLAQPYGSSYDLSGVSNPRGWAVSVLVSYWAPSRVPAFDPAYPDAGLERVEVRVSDPEGRERAVLAVLKAR